MQAGVWFWILMVLWLLLGVYWSWRPPEPRWTGGWLLLPFVLFALIGWAVFGTPVK